MKDPWGRPHSGVAAPTARLATPTKGGSHPRWDLPEEKSRGETFLEGPVRRQSPQVTQQEQGGGTNYVWSVCSELLLTGPPQLLFMLLQPGSPGPARSDVGGRDK